jgi:hypothetical protein
MFPFASWFRRPSPSPVRAANPRGRARLRLEQLEERRVLSTLMVDLGGNAHYIGSNNVDNHVALSERRIPIEPPQGSGLPIFFLTQYRLEDTAETITVTGPGAARWGGSGTHQVSTLLAVPSLLLDLQNGNDFVNVQATVGPVTIQGHGGPEKVTVGSLAPTLGGTLGLIQGAVQVSNTTNSTTLIVDDSGDPAARSVTISFDSVVFASIGSPIQYFAGVQSVEVFGSQGGDVFQFLPQFSTTPIFIHAGSSPNTLVSVTGVNNWTIAGPNAGTLDNVTFQNVQNLRAGPSSVVDTFHFTNGGSVDGTIVESNPGNTGTLDYSAFTNPVVVNLQTHTATAVHGGVVPAVFNIRNVTGGFGTNIIVGDGNNNFLRGGVGRSIVISGGGNSTLQAGVGEAILIGGRYLFATDPTALAHLMAEWSHTYDPINPLHDYHIRVDHLVNGGGLNDPYRLNASTVKPDPGTQRLTSGAQLDFLILDPFDILTNPVRPGEVVLPV